MYTNTYHSWSPEHIHLSFDYNENLNQNSQSRYQPGSEQIVTGSMLQNKEYLFLKAKVIVNLDIFENFMHVLSGKVIILMKYYMKDVHI